MFLLGERERKKEKANINKCAANSSRENAIGASGVGEREEKKRQNRRRERTKATTYALEGLPQKAQNGVVGFSFPMLQPHTSPEYAWGIWRKLELEEAEVGGSWRKLEEGEEEVENPRLNIIAKCCIVKACCCCCIVNCSRCIFICLS